MTYRIIFGLSILFSPPLFADSKPTIDDAEEVALGKEIVLAQMVQHYYYLPSDIELEVLNLDRKVAGSSDQEPLWNRMTLNAGYPKAGKNVKVEFWYLISKNIPDQPLPDVGEEGTEYIARTSQPRDADPDPTEPEVGNVAMFFGPESPPKPEPVIIVPILSPRAEPSNEGIRRQSWANTLKGSCTFRKRVEKLDEGEEYAILVDHRYLGKGEKLSVYYNSRATASPVLVYFNAIPVSDLIEWKVDLTHVATTRLDSCGEIIQRWVDLKKIEGQ